MRTLLALLAASPALAQTPLSGDAFDDLTRGRTYYYAEDGIPYGAEQYRPGRQVVWSFLDGNCIRGMWYESGESICFVYEDFEEPQCWQFFQEGGLRARLLGGDSDLKELGRTSEPLQCLGPDVGA